MGPNAQVQARLGRARPGLAQPRSVVPGPVVPGPALGPAMFPSAFQDWAPLCPARPCPARPSARRAHVVRAQPGRALSDVWTSVFQDSSKPAKAGPRFWACARTRSPIHGAVKGQAHTQNRPCPVAPGGLKRDFFGRRRQSDSTRGALQNGASESVDGLN